MRQRSVGVAEAKKCLSELLDRVADRGESIVIHRRGQPLARLVPVTGRARSGLTNVRGWLDDSDPFFAAIEEIVAARHARRPRRPPSLGSER